MDYSNLIKKLSKLEQRLIKDNEYIVAYKIDIVNKKVMIDTNKRKNLEYVNL